MERFFRTEILIGNENLEKLKNSKVAVFGIGGVGSYAAMALARSGIYNIDLIDCDTVNITNINRQLVAYESTLGRKKTDVMKEIILDINPMANVVCHNVFIDKETIKQFDFSSYDYVVDAIDTVSSKLMMIELCEKSGTKIISSMGTGNKLNPAELEISDIYKTSVCPLARVMRQELKKRGIKKLKVIYSKEIPIKPNLPEERRVVGSTSFVPPVAGFIIASETVKDLIG